MESKQITQERIKHIDERAKACLTVFKERTPSDEILGRFGAYVISLDGQDLGYVAPIPIGKEEVYSVVSHLYNPKDVESVYYSQSDKKRLEKIRNRMLALYHKLTQKGFSWEDIKDTLRYFSYEKGESVICRKYREKHKQQTHGVTSYLDGAINVSRRKALNLAHILAGSRGVEVLDKSS